MIGDIGPLRARVRPSYLPIYKQLLKGNYIGQHSELFTLCCFIPSNNVMEDSVKLVELCQASSFTQYQLTSLSAQVYKNNQKFISYKDLFAEMEQSADKGMSFLIENVWNDVTTESEAGDMTIIPGREFEAQYLLASYINEKLTEVPF
ncbi:hypothetical protein [Halobacillus sp. Nhm2S1]|uniref:hypothetical protein n=1 Tax=Halobacillus sp. Nhm2S1 TaxID=2866716 RepID=UPI001C72BDE8|nr:hypothetical protein [Halobacillus sp. Nhm2S1]MBX0358359.1 hypothetical protein [Halobacillus sp. Nhm2S1]